MNTLLIIYYVIYILGKRLREYCVILLLLIYAWIVFVIYASILSLVGHFRVSLCLCFKASLSAKLFLWKWLWLQENETVCRTHFHMKGFTLRLVLKQRYKRTRKWPIYTFLDEKIFIQVCITWSSCWLITCLRLQHLTMAFFTKRTDHYFWGAVFKNNRSVAFCYRNFDFWCKKYLAW